MENAGTIRPDQLDELRAAQQGSRFVLDHDDDGNLELHLRISSEADRGVADIHSYIETHAPPDVANMLADGHRCLTEGDFDGAIDRARKTLQKLSTTAYHNALDERVSNNLIRSGDGNNIAEREMLYMPYGFCSEIGEHTDPDQPAPNALQAETALRLVEEAVHYILPIHEQANKDDIALTRWNTS